MTSWLAHVNDDHVIDHDDLQRWELPDAAFLKHAESAMSRDAEERLLEELYHLARTLEASDGIPDDWRETIAASLGRYTLSEALDIARQWSRLNRSLTARPSDVRMIIESLYA